MRVGLALGYDPAMGIEEMADVMRTAEERGYETGLFSETINLVRDSVTALAAFGLATSTLMLGTTQIVRLRSPIVMAQTAASLDELTGGRFILAPGACTRNHARFFGLEHIDPVLTLTEWVQAMRLLLTGDRVSFAGQVVRFKSVQLAWKPPRDRIPMWIAATSRTGLRLAGQIGDGVLLNAVASPEYCANAIKIVHEAVNEAGKDWSSFEIAKIVNCSIDEDRDRAFDTIRWEVASKFHPLRASYNARIRAGVGEPFIQADDMPKFKNAYNSGGKDALARAIPISYIEGLTASGTADDVRSRVQRYRDAGVMLPLLRPAARHQTRSLLDLFAPARARSQPI